MQMHHPLNPHLRDIIEIKEHVCESSEAEENEGCYHEQEGVEVGLLRGLGGRYAHWPFD